MSFYYFERNGDDFRPYLKRRKAGDHESFDKCVVRDGEDCAPENLWVQIPYFCGHLADCWEPGIQWALDEAKRNVLHHYLVVDVTTELRDFLAVLEELLPWFFRVQQAFTQRVLSRTCVRHPRKFRPNQRR